jgi:hypothetical protein
VLLFGYCLGIRSERRLCEEVHLNLAYRWFCRLDLTDRVPGHSSFSKNRHALPGRQLQCKCREGSFPRQRSAASLVRDDRGSVHCRRAGQRPALCSGCKPDPLPGRRLRSNLQRGGPMPKSKTQRPKKTGTQRQLPQQMRRVLCASILRF